MVRKLGGDDDAFVSYRTPHYKLHFYETASSLRLVMLTDTATLSMRNVLHQIYINLWVEFGTSSFFPLRYMKGVGVGWNGCVANSKQWSRIRSRRLSIRVGRG
jgi:hypothetical protein